MSEAVSVVHSLMRLSVLDGADDFVDDGEVGGCKMATRVRDVRTLEAHDWQILLTENVAAISGLVSLSFCAIHPSCGGNKELLQHFIAVDVQVESVLVAFVEPMHFERSELGSEATVGTQMIEAVNLVFLTACRCVEQQSFIGRKLFEQLLRQCKADCLVAEVVIMRQDAQAIRAETLEDIELNAEAFFKIVGNRLALDLLLELVTHFL